MITAMGINWDGEIALDDRANIPNKAGIYCVCDKDTALYVGRSDCGIRTRWQAGHHKLPKLLEIQAQQKRPLLIRWVGVDATPEVEQHFINLLTPLLNDTSAHSNTSTIESTDRPIIKRTYGIFEDQETWLKAEAFRRHKTIHKTVPEAAIVREALDAYMKEEKHGN